MFHLQSAFMFCAPFLEQAVVIRLCSINRLVFITKMECVHCAESLWRFYIFQVSVSLIWLKATRGESATFYVFAKEEAVGFPAGWKIVYL
jgi:hypothetical protein